MKARNIYLSLCGLTLAALLIGGCGGNRPDNAAGATAPAALAPVTLQAGEKLRVVATTGLIADVVAHVGGEHIELSQLIPTGTDPHGFAPTPQDLRTLNDAQVIFINGLGLEESLLPVLQNLDRAVPLVTVNDGVDTLTLGAEGDHAADEDAHAPGAADPHTWFSVHNVQIWTDAIAATLQGLDPAHAADYAAAAAAYKETLAALDRELRAQIDAVPAAQRKIVTDHNALGYLAHEYGIQIIGAIVPSFSTMASPSARELAALQTQIRAEGVHAILVGTTVNPQTAEQLAQDLGIRVGRIYTGSLSDASGPTPTYVDFMRYNVATIVDALR